MDQFMHGLDSGSNIFRRRTSRRLTQTRSSPLNFYISDAFYHANAFLPSYAHKPLVYGKEEEPEKEFKHSNYDHDYLYF